MILKFNNNYDKGSSNSDSKESNEKISELFHKYFDITKSIGSSLNKIDKLISENIDDREYFKIFKSLFSVSFDDDDLIEYLNFSGNKKYSGICSIKTNLLTKHTRDVSIGSSTFMKIEDANISYKVVYSSDFSDKHKDLMEKADIRSLMPYIESGDVVIIGRSYSEVIPGEFPFLVSKDKRSEIPMINGSETCNELDETLKYGIKNSAFPFVMSQIRSDDAKLQLCEVRNRLRTNLHNRLCDVSSLLRADSTQNSSNKVLQKARD